MGTGSSEQLKARQQVQSQLHSADEAVVPLCLVSVVNGQQTAAAQSDYHQCGSADISLQVSSSLLSAKHACT